MNYAASYIAALAVFLANAMVWIRTVMQPVFERNVGALLRDEPRLSEAVGFGVLAYGTYEATNFATLKGWSVQMLAVDIAWGASLTAVTAVAGYLTCRWTAG